MTTGIQCRRDLQGLGRGLLLREQQDTAGGERRKVNRQNSKMESVISSGQKQCIEMENTHILLCDLRSYLNKTREDYEKTNQDVFLCVLFSL